MPGKIISCAVEYWLLKPVYSHMELGIQKYNSIAWRNKKLLPENTYILAFSYYQKELYEWFKENFKGKILYESSKMGVAELHKRDKEWNVGRNTFMVIETLSEDAPYGPK